MYIVNGRPNRAIRNLKQIKYSAVHTPNREVYDKLMKITECMGLEWGMKWHWEDFPTEIDMYKDFKEETSIFVNKNVIIPNTREYFRKLNYDIITPEKFYEIQELNEDFFKKVNDWFDKNKPQRESLGLEKKLK